MSKHAYSPAVLLLLLRLLFMHISGRYLGDKATVEARIKGATSTAGGQH
jgi:hypothetical protein